MPTLRRKLPSSSSLFVFEAAARCGSFTRAANELCVSQPAVSRMLSRLEQHLGVALFERARAGARLTEEGELLFANVQEGFATIESAIDELTARATGLETVTLSLSTAFTTHWLMPRMSLFTQRFPQVDLRFQLMAGRIGGPLVDVDLGMRYLLPEAVQPADLRLMPELTVPVFTPAYRDAQYSNGQPPTLICMDNQGRDWASGLCLPGKPENSLVFTDYAVVVQAALLGQGVALGWLNVVAHSLAKGELLPAATPVTRAARYCCLVSPPNRPLRPVVGQVRDWIAEQLQQELLEVQRLYPELGIAQALAGVAE